MTSRTSSKVLKPPGGQSQLNLFHEEEKQQQPSLHQQQHQKQQSVNRCQSERNSSNIFDSSQPEHVVKKIDRNASSISFGGYEETKNSGVQSDNKDKELSPGGDEAEDMIENSTPTYADDDEKAEEIQEKHGEDDEAENGDDTVIEEVSNTVVVTNEHHSSPPQRSSTRVIAPPGGRSSINLFG